MLGIHQELASVYFSRGSARGDAGDEVRNTTRLSTRRSLFVWKMIGWGSPSDEQVDSLKEMA